MKEKIPEKTHNFLLYVQYRVKRLLMDEIKSFLMDKNKLDFGVFWKSIATHCEVKEIEDSDLDLVEIKMKLKIPTEKLLD